jgi:hypothetical protein
MILHKNVNSIVAELIHLIVSSVFSCMPRLCHSLLNTTGQTSPMSGGIVSASYERPSSQAWYSLLDVLL